jgi:hypothetical protein
VLARAGGFSNGTLFFRGGVRSHSWAGIGLGTTIMYPQRTTVKWEEDCATHSELAEGISPRGFTYHCIHRAVYFAFPAAQPPSTKFWEVVCDESGFGGSGEYYGNTLTVPLIGGMKTRVRAIALCASRQPASRASR